jgi:capsular polysaccharide biosynthesis protein
MQSNQIVPLIKEKIGVIILAGVLVAALSFLFMVVSQKNFKVTSDFLVVQDQEGQQDYYALSKSAEYVSKIFSEAIYSDLFIDETIKTGKISAEFLPFDKKARLDEWNKIVKVKRNPDVSMLSVTVFGNSKDETVKISEGIAEVLATKSYLFRGSGLNVDVRLLSGPIVEKNPSFTEIILVMIGGFIIGVLLSLVWLFYFYNPTLVLERKIENLKKSEAVYNFPEPDEYEESLRYLDKK